MKAGNFLGSIILLALCFWAAPLNKTASFLNHAPVWAAEASGRDYRQSMVELIAKINGYAKSKNSSFQVIQNDGTPLFSGDESKTLAENVDGVLLEGLYFSWRLNYFQRTPSADTKEKETNLQAPQEAGLTILNIDYCDTVAMINKSIKLNKAKNIIGFAAPERELSRLPKYPWQIVNENTNDITSLKQIKNFAALLNPARFVNKKYYLDNLQANNYDLLIIDLSYQGTPLTPADLAFLKQKKNGAARLVFAYMSTGEAESYRSYWQEEWQEKPPPWVDALNEQWEENYKVKYWMQDWQDILFGSPEAYLDQILAAGFDGVFLDVIDACFYFEEKAGE